MKEERNNTRQEPVPEEPRQHEHKPLTLAQNIVLTVKVLMGAAMVLGAIAAVEKLAS